MQTLLVPVAFWLAVFAISVAMEPRKVRNGVYLTIAVSAAVLPLLAMLFARFVDLASRLLPDAAAAQGWLLVGLGAIFLGAVLVMGGMLIANGIDLWRKEGRTLANSLSLALGLGIVAYAVAAVLVLLSDQTSLFLILLALAIPIAYLGFALVSYVSYAFLYSWWNRLFGRQADAVIVLGAGLRNGKVTPLLASRVDLGIKWFRRQTERGPKPRFVVSGGKGHDEIRSEAAAMAEYAVEHGMQPAEVLLEDESRNTRENIVFSGRLLTQTDPIMRAAVVTNDFHAFRAALLMRRSKMPGYAIGAVTAGYYRPSATLREFVAVLVEHKGLNIALMAAAFLPLLALVVAQLLN